MGATLPQAPAGLLRRPLSLHTPSHDAILLTDKLRNLNVSSTSIEGTSAWVCYHRAHANRIAAIWEDVFSRADDGKRLALLYLTNDIVQNRWALILACRCMAVTGGLAVRSAARGTAAAPGVRRPRPGVVDLGVLA